MKHQLKVLGVIGAWSFFAACGDGDGDGDGGSPNAAGSAGSAGSVAAQSGSGGVGGEKSDPQAGRGGALDGSGGSLAGAAGAAGTPNGSAGTINGAGGAAGSAGSSNNTSGAAGAAGTAGAPSTLPMSCKDIKAMNADANSGKYNIYLDLDENDSVEEIEVTCDMKTAGGGWTVIYATSGANGSQPITSDTRVYGNPFGFENMNEPQALKVVLSQLSREVLFVRSDVDKYLIVKGRGEDADRPIPFSAKLRQPNQSEDLAVVISIQGDTTETPAFMGYSNYNIRSGGDFNLSVSNAEGAATCLGAKILKGVDHHSTNYWQLNCACTRQYLYSYSADQTDGDPGYDWNIPLGAWTRTQECDAAEGGRLAFRVAVR